MCVSGGRGGWGRQGQVETRTPEDRMPETGDRRPEIERETQGGGLVPVGDKVMSGESVVASRGVMTIIKNKEEG